MFVLKIQFKFKGSTLSLTMVDNIVRGEFRQY